MKTIGLIGGMSWESTVTYYQILNREVKERLGGLHSAKCLLYSVDFAEIEACQTAGEWEKAGDMLAGAAQALARAGAEGIVLCTNTMHKVAPAIEESVDIPLLHIADVTADALERAGIRRAALIGTRYTMEQNFYTGRLRARGLEVLLPEAEQRREINRVIFEELCLGVISPASRDYFVRVIAGLAAAGAEGVILGCTEIGLLIGAGDTSLPVFDTTVLHAKAAVDWAIGEL